MPIHEEFMPKVKLLLQQRGMEALKVAQKTILHEKVGFAPLREALEYFIGKVWLDLLHPSLISLASESVGGRREHTVAFGAAFVLLAGGADIHDDIIDQSQTKEGKPTVFGQFGRDIAILSGDALLFEGLYLLHEAAEPLSRDRKQQILEAVKSAFWGISGAEAEEANLRCITDLPGQNYFDIIKKKVAVAEASMKVGAILGGGTPREIELLSEYGRIFGILNTIRDEYIDVFDAEELKNRAEKECLPLPMLYAFKNPQTKAQILKLLQQQLNEETMERVVDLTIDSEETKKLTDDLRTLANQEIKNLAPIKRGMAELELLTKATLEDL